MCILKPELLILAGKENWIMKDKRVIRQVLTIYLVCFVARIFEYFVLRTDQTILGEAFIHKLFGIIVICLVVKRSGETHSDIGFVKNGYISVYDLLT